MFFIGGQYVDPYSILGSLETWHIICRFCSRFRYFEALKITFFYADDTSNFVYFPLGEVEFSYSSEDKGGMGIDSLELSNYALWQIRYRDGELCIIKMHYGYKAELLVDGYD